MHTFVSRHRLTQGGIPRNLSKTHRAVPQQDYRVRSLLQVQRSLRDPANPTSAESFAVEVEKDRASLDTSSPQHEFTATTGTLPPKSLQRKLKVSKPGDSLEREAERTADRIVRMSAEQQAPAPRESSVFQPGSDDVTAIQRLAAHRSPSFEDAVVLGEEESESAPVQTLRAPHSAEGPEAVSLRRLRGASNGVPISWGVRRFMETQFGFDFRPVRIHADHHAAELSDSLNARAFTHGPHVFFGHDEYRPQTQEGTHVLAHELTHVVQQGAAPKLVPAGENAAGDESVSAGREPEGLQRLSAPGRVRRRNVAPWGADGPTGTDYDVTTDRGSTVTGWIAYSPWRVPLQYWCHGHSVDSYANHGYSVYSGQNFARVVADEWTNIPPDQTRAGDMAVWTENMDHSAKFTDPVVQGGQLEPDRSMLSTKNGQAPVAKMSLNAIAAIYGGRGISVFRRR